MPQPISVGAVLGGRYRITEHVVTSADQDMVFLGADQVLNRRVTVLVASRENATQVASSARELATGERTDDVQVLDLGLSEGRTYLIAGGGPDPDVLLGLAYPQEVYVEPFQTDTLGSEIFGESRTEDPRPRASTTRSASRIRVSPCASRYSTPVTRPAGVPPPVVDRPDAVTPSQISMVGSARTFSRRTRSMRMREE